MTGIQTSGSWETLAVTALTESARLSTLVARLWRLLVRYHLVVQPWLFILSDKAGHSPNFDGSYTLVCNKLAFVIPVSLLVRIFVENKYSSEAAKSKRESYDVSS